MKTFVIWSIQWFSSDIKVQGFRTIYTQRIAKKGLKMKKMDSYLALEIGHLHHDSTAGILVTHAI